MAAEMYSTKHRPKPDISSAAVVDLPSSFRKCINYFWQILPEESICWAWSMRQSTANLALNNTLCCLEQDICKNLAARTFPLWNCVIWNVRETVAAYLLVKIRFSWVVSLWTVDRRLIFKAAKAMCPVPPHLDWSPVHLLQLQVKCAELSASPAPTGPAWIHDGTPQPTGTSETYILHITYIVRRNLPTC